MKKKIKRKRVVFPAGIDCSFLRDAIKDFLREIRKYEIPDFDFVETVGEAGFRIYLDAIGEDDIEEFKDTGEFYNIFGEQPIIYPDLKKLIADKVEKWREDREEFVQSGEDPKDLTIRDQNLGRIEDQEIWEFTLTKKYKYSQFGKKLGKAAHSTN